LRLADATLRLPREVEESFIAKKFGPCRPSALVGQNELAGFRSTAAHQIELPHVAVELKSPIRLSLPKARSPMRLITFILSSAIALTCIPAFASAASKTLSQASVSTTCPTYEGYPDCR